MKNLPPLDLTEDVKRFEAHSESREVAFSKCPHKQVEYTDGQLRCKCGVGWTGARLGELHKLLTS